MAKKNPIKENHIHTIMGVPYVWIVVENDIIIPFFEEENARKHFAKRRNELILSHKVFRDVDYVKCEKNTGERVVLKLRQCKIEDHKEY